MCGGTAAIVPGTARFAGALLSKLIQEFSLVRSAPAAAIIAFMLAVRMIAVRVSRFLHAGLLLTSLQLNRLKPLPPRP